MASVPSVQLAGVFSPQAHQELETLEEEMGQMQDCARLFEVALPEYKQMKQCRREIWLLKGLWDVIIYIRVRWTWGIIVLFHNRFE